MAKYQDKRFADERNFYLRFFKWLPAVVIVLGLGLFGIVKISAWLFPKNAAQTRLAADDQAKAVAKAADDRKNKLILEVNQLREAVSGYHWEQASSLAEEILRENPDYGPAWSARGLVRESQGDQKAAMEAYTRALELSDDPVNNFFRRARLRRVAGDVAGARADLEAAAKIEPNNPLVSNTLMIMKIQAGETKEIRDFLAAAKQAQLRSGSDAFVVGAAALALQDGNFPEAAIILGNAPRFLSAQVLRQLLQDPFFQPYLGDERLRSVLPAGIAAQASPAPVP